MKRWALLVGVSGCAHPASSPDRETPLIRHDIVDDVKLRVTAPGYSVTFGADGSLQLPEKIATSGTSNHGNVLGTDDCPAEGLMGAAIYPGATAIGGQTGTSEGFLELAGPAVARVRVTYNVPYSCGGTAQHLSGEQVLTMFPDGRIFRRDTVTSSDTPLPATSSCGCANMTTPDFFFTLFYAFSNDATIVDDQDRQTQMADRTETCAQWNDLTIGLRWLDGSNTRITPNAAPSFVLDMMTASSAPFAVVADRTQSSMMMIASGTPHPNCGGVLAQMWQPPIMIGTLGVSATDDGIYVDMRPHTSSFDITSSAAVGPFALSLQLGSHAKITSNVAHDDGWYTVQAESVQTILWFSTGLASGETITVEPL